MRISFTKMQGAGNDYIYFDCMEKMLPEPEKVAVRLSDRHFGVGGDGIVLICPSDKADAKMRMFNLDGSEGKMCGNAIRCVAKYLYERKNIRKEELRIDTLSGIKTLHLTLENQKVASVTVSMGKAEFSPEKLPVLLEGTEIVDVPLEVGDREYRITCVSMGNPHAVIFCPNPDEVNLEKIGPKLEKHPLFPESVNVEFVSKESDGQFRMRVWERGSGETLACGTGACATVAAAVKNGLCQPDTPVTVRLKGGELVIRYTDDTVWMTGPAEFVFDGEMDLN